MNSLNYFELIGAGAGALGATFGQQEAANMVTMAAVIAILTMFMTFYQYGGWSEPAGQGA